MSILNGLVAALAILAGLGSAAAFLSVGRQRGRVAALEAQADLLRNDVGDRDRRINFQAAEIERLKASEALMQRKVDTLVSDNARLRGIVEGMSGPLHDVADRIDQHHDATMKAFADVMGLLGNKRGGS